LMSDAVTCSCLRDCRRVIAEFAAANRVIPPRVIRQRSVLAEPCVDAERRRNHPNDRLRLFVAGQERHSGCTQSACVVGRPFEKR
jgi:hypothetical protein